MILDKKFKDFLLHDKSTISTALMVTNSDELDFVSLADDNSISFREKDKESEDPWDKKGRTKVKPGKFVNKVLKDVIESGMVSTRDVERWVNSFKGHFEEMGNINIVSGDDIKWHYNSKNYTGNHGGSLWSCMSGEDCQSRMGIYTDNPETIKLVVQYDDNGKVKTRALLWTLENGVQLMDRIYYQTDHSLNTFARLCAENNWLLRDNVANRKFRIPLANWEFKEYPYLDTMRYIENDEDGSFYMTNVIEQNKRNSPFITPNGTAGYIVNNHVLVDGKFVPNNKAGLCAITRKGFLLEDLVEVERRGKIDKKLAKEDKWGNLFFHEDLVESTIMKGFIPLRGAYQLKESKDWIGRKKYRKLVESGKLEDGCAEYKGKTAWVLEENVAKQEEADKAIKDKMITDIVAIDNRANRDGNLDKLSLTKLLQTVNHYRQSRRLEEVKLEHYTKTEEV